ncbi:MAG TPA: isoprenylcysteine carboxylmethyltransferase family protein [Anaeromyxobacteraceae bacterium]|nr:isoprenylcysteine carboxylmethyltransferase family protein [Anaeromyxobacteraceae bacterium]
MARAFLALQALFAGLFLVRELMGYRHSGGAGSPRAEQVTSTPRAGLHLLPHAVGIAFVIWGVTNSMNARRGQLPMSPPVIAGIALLVAAWALAFWALRVFESWRLLPRLEAGHALCVDGPYRHVRHPIYLAMDLWAVGSVLACPWPLTLVGVVIVLVAGDLRGRAEEALLLSAFGDEYRAYKAKVSRFVPGIY